jgi:hypothetical protein
MDLKEISNIITPNTETILATGLGVAMIQATNLLWGMPFFIYAVTNKIRPLVELYERFNDMI